MLVWGVALVVEQFDHDRLSPEPAFVVVFSIFLFTNRLGSFGRYFVPIALGTLAYVATSSYAATEQFAVHYKPQIALDRALTLGHGLPTVWLQQHLYDGRTGPLEAIAVAAYAGHFLIPFALTAALILTRRGESIQLLMFGLLTAALAAMVVFVLAPTAPPWLADQQGYITGVHHILKQSLADLRMDSLAAAEGDGNRYDIAAAMPSLHTAFALLCVFGARHARLPRWVVGALVLNAAAVVFSIVYTGEHYASDALGGALLAVLSWKLVTALSRRAQPSRAGSPTSSG
jgi:membrane-associated phospholipid phosphatase